MTRLLSAVVFSLSVLSVPALAEPILDATPDDSPRVEYRPVTEIAFDEQEIQADLIQSNLEWIGERERSRFNPLISLRTDFNAEMSRSVREIR